jgi:hypothetical protein
MMISVRLQTRIIRGCNVFNAFRPVAGARNEALSWETELPGNSAEL